MSHIHVRLRSGRDDDIARWYEGQPNKSQAVREAIRAYIRLEDGDGSKENMRDMVQTVVRKAVADQLSRLPGVIAAVVRDVLTEWGVGRGEVSGAGGEDAELAARLDGQLDAFFEEK